MSQEKLWTKDFVFGTLVNLLLMINYYSLMVVVTSYAMKTYGAPASTAGLAASMFIIGALVSRLASGGLMGAVGRKRLLLVGAACEVVFSLLYLADVGFALLFVLRFLHGFAYGSCSTTISTAVTSLVPATRKGEGVGYFMLSVTLGAAVGPFLGMFLSQNAGYHPLFIAASAAAAVCLLAIAFMKVPEAPSAATRAPQTRASSAASDANAAHDASAASATTAPAPRRRFSIASVLEFSVLPIGAVCAILFFCYSSLLTFLTPFSEEAGLQTAASFFFVVYAVATFVTRPFTGRLFDRKGDKLVMVPAFVAFIAGMALLANASHAAMLLGSAALLGFGVGTVQSSGLSLAVRIAPENRLNLANSTFYALLDVGVGIGPLVLGLVEPLWGYRGLFLAMAALAVVALGAYLLVGRKNGTLRKRLGA